MHFAAVLAVLERHRAVRTALHRAACATHFSLAAVSAFGEMKRAAREMDFKSEQELRAWLEACGTDAGSVLGLLPQHKLHAFFQHSRDALHMCDELAMITDDHYERSARSVDLLALLGACDPAREGELLELINAVAKPEEDQDIDEPDVERPERSVGDGAASPLPRRQNLSGFVLQQLGPTPSLAELEQMRADLAFSAAELAATAKAVRADVDAHLPPLVIRFPYDVEPSAAMRARAERLAQGYRLHCVFGRFANRIPVAVREAAGAVQLAAEHAGRAGASPVAAAAAAAAGAREAQDASAAR